MNKNIKNVIVGVGLSGAIVARCLAEHGEQAFLSSAKETIKRGKPILLLSIYHSWSDLDYFKVKEMLVS